MADRADANPFEAFESPSDPRVADHVMLLEQTRPWLYFMGGLTALGAALFLLITLSMGAMSLIGLSSLPQDDAMGALGGGAVMSVIFAFYGLFGVLYGFFAWFMIRQAQAITAVRRGGGLDALARVLRAHRDFWRLAGISTLAIMVLYCGGIIAVGMIGANLAQTFDEVSEHL